MSYKRLGDYIIEKVEFNDGDKYKLLQGVSNNKYFQKAKTNIIGIDLSKYRVAHYNQFVFNRATTRNGDKISIALRKGESCIVSPSYRIFEVRDENVLHPDYLQMWFTRPEFDRYARFKSHGSAHEFFDMEDMCEVELPIPSIEEQRQIVAQYQSIVNKIKVNEQICEKLEAAAQALYKHWFVDFNNANITTLEDYIITNPSLNLKKGDVANYTEMSDLSENKLSIKLPIKREYNGGSRFQNNDTLLARITPCLENGKTGFVNFLSYDEIGFGSTEFIVVRPKSFVSPFWIYCLCKDEDFRAFAISSMIGSSGRQRVHESYLLKYKYSVINEDVMNEFHKSSSIIFEEVKLLDNQNQKLRKLQSLLLSRLAVGEEVEAS